MNRRPANPPPATALPTALALSEARRMAEEADLNGPYEPYELQRRIAGMIHLVSNDVSARALDPGSPADKRVLAILGGADYLRALEEWVKADRAWRRTHRGDRPVPPAIPGVA